MQHVIISGQKALMSTEYMDKTNILFKADIFQKYHLNHHYKKHHSSGKQVILQIKHILSQFIK